MPYRSGAMPGAIAPCAPAPPARAGPRTAPVRHGGTGGVVLGRADEPLRWRGPWRAAAGVDAGAGALRGGGLHPLERDATVRVPRRHVAADAAGAAAPRLRPRHHH